MTFEGHNVLIDKNPWYGRRFKLLRSDILVRWKWPFERSAKLIDNLRRPRLSNLSNNWGLCGIENIFVGHEHKNRKTLGYSKHLF